MESAWDIFKFKPGRGMCWPAIFSTVILIYSPWWGNQSQNSASRCLLDKNKANVEPVMFHHGKYIVPRRYRASHRLGRMELNQLIEGCRLCCFHHSCTGEIDLSLIPRRWDLMDRQIAHLIHDRIFFHFQLLIWWSGGLHYIWNTVLHAQQASVLGGQPVRPWRQHWETSFGEFRAHRNRLWSRLGKLLDLMTELRWTINDKNSWCLWWNVVIILCDNITVDEVKGVLIDYLDHVWKMNMDSNVVTILTNPLCISMCAF